MAWLAGGAGVILLYSAYKNVSPVSVVSGRLSGDNIKTPIDSSSGSTVVSGDYGGDYSKGNTVSAPSSDVARAQQLAARSITPIIVPIPSQPTMMLDYIAVKSFMGVQGAFGALIPITGGYRSYATQAKRYQEAPSRFAPPGHSLHEVGLAVDVNTDRVDVNAAPLIKAFSDHGWYRVGKSGPMHWSYGVPG